MSMTDMNGLRSNKWAIRALVGLLSFWAGLLILHSNPYWGIVRTSNVVPHRVYAWNAIGHLISGVGLMLVLGSAASLLSRLFSTKWLYWTGVVAAIALWCGLLGIAHTYEAHYAWDARTGITDFSISKAAASQELENPAWQAIVRWQAEPELNGWLHASRSKRTHGWLSIRVVRIVPIAFPTLSCDCSNCCIEEGSAAPGR